VPEALSGFSLFWVALALFSLVLLLDSIVERLMLGSPFDRPLLVAAGFSAVFIAVRLVIRVLDASITSPAPAPDPDEPLEEIVESAGPMVLAIGREGRVTYANPSAERLLGYHAAELKAMANAEQILARGEAERLVSGLKKVPGWETSRLAAGALLAHYLRAMEALPPSQVPSFDVHLQTKDGSLLLVTMHISALRTGSGTLSGLVAVALEQSVGMHQEQALRESQERYRDLFENSSEMIGTLSPEGRFLYANPAWKSGFGLENSVLLELKSFDQLFGAECSEEVRALFRRALQGEAIDRASVRNHTADGRVQDLELTLSQRQKAGNPLAVRCLLRDVTHQKQRENRLALQLSVSQIVGDNSSPDVAAMRILEAICVSQNWDAAIKWEVNADEKRLEFSSAWGAPGPRTEALIQQSMGLSMARGRELPGRVWAEGRAIWATDLVALPPGPHLETALRHEMVSGWAAPVRVGNKLLAVLEFYSHYRLREDPEAIMAVETVAASLGQMLARSQERGRAEELYRQQQILLDSVADGICGVDRQGLVSFANPAAARLLGAEAAGLKGRPVHELLHGAAPPARKCHDDCPLRTAMGNHVAAAGEETIFRADGSSFPAEYFSTPIMDLGRFSGSVLSFRDISQRNALDRLKDEFISTVSHELRTPLTSIRGALGLLTSGILGEVSDKAANLLRIASSNSDRLVRLINDILDLERIQSGREPLAFRSVQLGDIVRQAIDGMQPVAEAAGVQLIHDTAQVEIAADGDRLIQVLTNLLSNAIKFSPPSSTVSVMLRPGASGVTLSVIDHGRGIPADKLESIFGRFQQVDASDSRQKGGSGLGLAICRTIVMQHSGRIWAERNRVRGSTFRVFLPYQATPSSKSPVLPDDEAGQGTVLLADANEITRMQVAAQLARHGYRVMETSTVEQTLSAASEGVEAILLDTALDGMNGWQILPLLRRLDPAARTPIVLLSVDRKPGEGNPLAEVEGWVAQPLDEEALLGELARVLCGDGQEARILVIEDDAGLAEVIRQVFSRDGITVEVAHTRQAALDLCHTFEPHLMVLDIGLPDGDGFNVVDWLRQHRNLAQLPLVVYSGREITPEERRQLTLGPTHFLTKARVQPQQLEALVLTMLRSSRQMEEATPVTTGARKP